MCKGKAALVGLRLKPVRVVNELLRYVNASQITQPQSCFFVRQLPFASKSASEMNTAQTKATKRLRVEPPKGHQKDAKKKLLNPSMSSPLVSCWLSRISGTQRE